MNDAIRVKMAEAEGWRIVKNMRGYSAKPPNEKAFSSYYMRQNGAVGGYPAYDNDNDLDRFIRAMGRRHLIKYRVALYHVTKPTGQQVAESTELRMIVATVEQKQASIIRAMGLEGVTV